MELEELTRRADLPGFDAGDMSGPQVSGGQIVEFRARPRSIAERQPPLIGPATRLLGSLSHAVTMAGRADVDALFDRLGWRSGTNVVETQAALDAGQAIERELKSAKRR